MAIISKFQVREVVKVVVNEIIKRIKIIEELSSVPSINFDPLTSNSCCQNSVNKGLMIDILAALNGKQRERVFNEIMRLDRQKNALSGREISLVFEQQLKPLATPSQSHEKSKDRSTSQQNAYGGNFLSNIKIRPIL